MDEQCLMAWLSYQRPARMQRDGDAFLLESVRFGFIERGPHLEDWKPNFGTARIVPGQVAHVYVDVSPFSPPETVAGQAFLVFQFDSHHPTLDSRALVVSMEARLRQGQSFSLLGGSLGRFPILYQFGSWRDSCTRTAAARGVASFDTAWASASC
ncbi:MAG: lipoprotein N-acyltransferase Lnb domain-containing protein [Candidatus Xenobia bacterium]